MGREIDYPDDENPWQQSVDEAIWLLGARLEEINDLMVLSDLIDDIGQCSAARRKIEATRALLSRIEESLDEAEQYAVQDGLKY